GQWIISEGDIPAYYIYKRLNGKVSYNEDGTKIREIEVKEGDKPVILGFTSALRDDRLNHASVKAESDVKTEMLSVDSIQGILKHDIPDAMKEQIKIMTDTIVLGNHIKSLKRKMSALPRIAEEQLEIKENKHKEVYDLLAELKEVYSQVVNEKELVE
ncbi:MAG: hypothetical protein ACE5EN_11910, partial [Nitrospinota bacterium]